MKASIIVLLFFISGILTGLFSVFPGFVQVSTLSEYALYLLMFLVGVGVGGDSNIWKTVKNANIRIVLVPVSVVIGSLAGTALCSLFINNMTMKEALAVGSGFGYYSLSSIIITKFHGETLGVVALLANMSREITTLLLSPLLVKYFGKLAPIASGGATAMDTTLPVITKSSGKEYVIISVFSGVILSILVPFIVTFLIK